MGVPAVWSVWSARCALSPPGKGWGARELPAAGVVDGDPAIRGAAHRVPVFVDVVVVPLADAGELVEVGVAVVAPPPVEVVGAEAVGGGAARELAGRVSLCEGATLRAGRESGGAAEVEEGAGGEGGDGADGGVAEEASDGGRG